MFFQVKDNPIIKCGWSRHENYVRLFSNFIVIEEDIDSKIFSVKLKVVRLSCGYKYIGGFQSFFMLLKFTFCEYKQCINNQSSHNSSSNNADFQILNLYGFCFLFIKTSYFKNIEKRKDNEIDFHQRERPEKLHLMKFFISTRQ